MNRHAGLTTVLIIIAGFAVLAVTATRQWQKIADYTARERKLLEFASLTNSLIDSEETSRSIDDRLKDMKDQVEADNQVLLLSSENRMLRYEVVWDPHGSKVEPERMVIIREDARDAKGRRMVLYGDGHISFVSD
jgi:hypothetical protein